MRENSRFHEHFDREETVELGSDRAFGFVIASFLALIGLYKLVWSIGAWWWLVPAAAFATAAAAWPKLLHPLNRLWFHLGLKLHAIINPLILGLMFFGAIVPTGMLMRALGKRPLKLGFDPAAKTYWIDRNPPGPPQDSFRNQF